jgi:hypothetical protein
MSDLFKSLAAGQKIPFPKGPGQFISKEYRTFVFELLECLMSPNIKVIIANSGVSPTTIDAKMTMAQNGWTAEIDLSSLGASAIAASAFFPFKIMLSPTHDVAEDWRTFRVRAGAVGTVAVAKTDGADTNPDSGAYPSPPLAYGAPQDTIVPSGLPAYYFWVDCTTVTTPFINSGSDRPGDGTDAAWWTGQYILIAKLDTSTLAASSQSIIRQYRRADIPLVCGVSSAGAPANIPV